MNLDSFTGPGSTPSRRRFWDQVTQAVIASQKAAGKNVTVDEHQGYGSVINVNPQRQTPAAGGCFLGTDAVIDMTFSGVVIDGLCQSYGGTASFIYSATGVDVNTSYSAAFIDTVDCFNVDPCPCGDPANLYDSSALIGATNLQSWLSSAVCSGPPDSDLDQDVLAAVYCDCTGLTVILGFQLFFIATGITAPGTYANEGVFNDLIHNPYFSDTLVAGHGGTVDISW